MPQDLVRHGPVRGLAGALLVWLGVAVVLSTTAAVSPVAAQHRRVVVLGDSIVLGAEGPMVARFAGRGWEVTFDATVSRSTSDAVAAVAAHRTQLTDSIVLSFGANDAGDVGAFRERVEQLLDAVSEAPRVYWLTIREVRDYYGPANQVLRDAAASRPDVTVVDWHAASAGRSDLTAADGLHLSGVGAAVMADLVVAAVADGATPLPPVTEPVPPPPTEPPTTVPVTTVPPAAAPTIPVATTMGTLSTAAPSTATPSAPLRTGRFGEATDTAPSGLDGIRVLGLTFGAAVLLVFAVLGGTGVVLGGWAYLVAGRRLRTTVADRET